MAAQVNIPYLRRKGGAYYWEPSRKVRALGFRAEPLGRDRGPAIDRALALNAQADEATRDTRSATPPAGTVARLVIQFQASERYKALSAGTRRDYDRYLAWVDEALGKLPAAALTRKVVKTYQGRIEAAKTRSVAAAAMRAFATFLSFVYDQGHLREHPGRQLGLAPAGERNTTWTDDQVRAFTEAALQEGYGSAALAVHMALWLGQRQGDVLNMAWSAYDPSRRVVTLTQRKSGSRLAVPVVEDLAALLDSAPRASPVIVINERTGRPHALGAFSKLFRAIANAAGLPNDLQFRDLRRTAATRLGEAGCSDDEIRAITAHRSRSVVARYVRPSDAMARAAMERLKEHLSRTATEKGV